MQINCELTLKVIAELQKKNIKCYVVGGYVRDSLLKCSSKDIDIELHNTTAQAAYEIIQTITPANYYGKFGIIALEQANTEFAIARQEVKSGVLHTDFDVEFILDGDLKLAASRRDFTINSMMYDLQTDQLIDFYGGQADLQHQILRHVSPRFSEDPLRILRGIKFMARYDLQIDPETDKLCQKIIEDLRHLPKSRIENELSATFTAKYFKTAAPLLTKYLNLLFDQELIATNLSVNGIPQLQFFRQFPDYAAVIDFCFEQKRVKSDLKLTLDNFEAIENYHTLSGEAQYNLFKQLKFVTAYAFAINPCIEGAYSTFLELCEKYDGQYFLSQGISGKQISHEQIKVIGGKLDELRDNY
ncbi:hypothetical protein RZE82_09535 [Mollicutes bacterium LVI A0039]|nr:hypothetical protein RZE82_09535 [Mollicutes bacterium LVI A0039]